MSHRRAGFTLIELLVVIALLGVITTMGLQMFSLMGERWRDTTATTDMHDAFVESMTWLRRDLEHVPSVLLEERAVEGVSREFEDREHFWGIRLADDTLTLTLAPHEEAGALARETRVTYRILRNAGEYALERVSHASGAKPETSQVIAQDAVALDVEYLGPGGQWRSGWNMKEPPSAVAVSLVLMRPNDPQEQIARREVFPIYVR